MSLGGSGEKAEYQTTIHLDGSFEWEDPGEGVEDFEGDQLSVSE